MSLTVYPSTNLSKRASPTREPVGAVPTGNDFLTPDGQVVPWAKGEAALMAHTAVVVGGLLVAVRPWA